MIGAATLPRSAAATAAAALPSSLASQSAKARVQALCAFWPGGAACHLLELRLDGSGAEVDASAAFMAPAMPALALAAKGVPCLSGLLPFLDWAAIALPRSLWLEWDLVDGVRIGDVGPCVFLAPPDLAQADAVKFIDTGLASMGVSQGEREAVRTICTRPGAMMPRQVGVMLSRKAAGVRLVFDTGSPEASIDLLHVIGSDAGEVVDGLSRLPGFEMARRLDLDITETGIGPRVAIEVPGAFVEADELARATMGLVSLGLADHEAAEALCKAVSWRDLEPGILIGLSHLKAAAEPNRPPVVKAYLSLVPSLFFANGDIRAEVLNNDGR